MNTEVYLPDYYRLFERIAKGWLLKPAHFFYKRFPSLNIDYNDFELLYGISKQQVVIELFRSSSY